MILSTNMLTLATTVSNWIDSGASAAEVLERLSNPEGLVIGLVADEITKRSGGIAISKVRISEPVPETEEIEIPTVELKPISGWVEEDWD